LTAPGASRISRLSLSRPDPEQSVFAGIRSHGALVVSLSARALDMRRTDSWSGPINRANWCASAATGSGPGWRPRVAARCSTPGAPAAASGSAP